MVVTLEDEGPELDKMRNILGWRADIGSQCPVQITDYYGPKTFTGQEKIVLNKKSLHLTPHAEFGGFGLGGMGIQQESFSKHSSRWKFSGHLLPGKGRQSWAYKSLKWDLSENDEEHQSTHANEVHTAFTFEHGGQPFFMRVEITGKLKKLHGRLKNKIMKFPSSARTDNSAVTLINFGERGLFKIPLDERARELEFEMEMANMNAIPMEVPDPKLATFTNLPINHQESNGTFLSQAGSRPQITRPMMYGQQQYNSIAAQSQFLGGAEHPILVEDVTEPTLANLAHAFNILQNPHQRSSRGEVPLATPPISTLAGVLNEHETSEEDQNSSSSDESLGVEPESPLSEEQVLVQILKMPGLLAFLRMIAMLSGLLGFLNQTSSVLVAVNDAGTRQRRGGSVTRVSISPEANLGTNLLHDAVVDANDTLEGVTRKRLRNRREQRIVNENHSESEGIAVNTRRSASRN